MNETPTTPIADNASSEHSTRHSEAMMTPEAQRIAIAEACGYHPNYYIESCETWAPAEVACVPDYLSDLNAMAEAEKVLTHAQKSLYVEELHDMVGTKGSVFATAAQRSLTFIKTLRLDKNDAA